MKTASISCRSSDHRASKSFRNTLLLVSLAISFTGVAGAGVLLQENFEGELVPTWSIEQVDAYTAGGWAYLQNPGDIAYRDAWIVTGEGNDWTDYSFKTRFIAEGGGSNWYNADIVFRVKEFRPWTQGTFYRLQILTPLWGGGNSASNGVYLSRWTEQSVTDLARLHPPEGTINAQDNTVLVRVVDGRIRVWINDAKVVDVIDPDPLPQGGVGLGATWESLTRYDYARVRSALRGHPLKVRIDIKPGNKRNIINPRSKGGVWVAILSSTRHKTPFDPSSQVDISTVRFGPGGALSARHRVKDLNRDGIGDLLLRFWIPDASIACNDSKAMLSGQTFDGRHFSAINGIRTVGCRPHGQRR